MIRAGRQFEQEYRLDPIGAGELFVELGEQLHEDDELTVTTEEWKLPFAFGEPVELVIDCDGVGELGIEVETRGEPTRVPQTSNNRTHYRLSRPTR